MTTGILIEDVRIRRLEPVDLHIPQGRCLGISGPSGSGKSLLLRAVADLEPYTGHISLDGEDAWKMPAPRWRSRVGLLPASSIWWNERVGDHFPSGPMTDDLEAAFSALGFAGETLDWSVHRLSSGEKQRLGLLRLLAIEPEALLLDEPTANLDETNTRRVETLIHEWKIRNNAPVIWVAHDDRQLDRIADSRYLIAEGRVTRKNAPSPVPVPEHRQAQTRLSG